MICLEESSLENVKRCVRLFLKQLQNSLHLILDLHVTFISKKRLIQFRIFSQGFEVFLSHINFNRTFIRYKFDGLNNRLHLTLFLLL